VSDSVKLKWPAPAGRTVRQIRVISSGGDLAGTTAGTPGEGSPGVAAQGARQQGTGKQGSGKQGTGTLQLGKPFGLAVAAAERLFVADPSHRGMVVFDLKTGSALRWTGSNEYPLAGPVAVAIDREGRVFAVDAYQSHVVVFDPTGRPTALLGKNVLKRPTSIAIDDRGERVYVSDTKLNKVLSFNLRSLAADKVMSDAPSGGSAKGGYLNEPSALAVNSKGDVLVSDLWRRRLLVFRAEGSLKGRVETECGSRGEYGRARPIAVDGADRIYVLDPDDDTLQIFTADGKPLWRITKLGAPPRKTLLRTGIAVDAAGSVYIAEQDDGTGRVRVLGLNLGSALLSTKAAVNRGLK
jgi:DNA-binding beta-propeller fold protein YncE